ncbi:LysR family transcriptional regulator [Streptomyces sp. NPDC102381]|uniref:LysR family transcriptional regulator n=1 Tax=Streptomyces sp. NPDC102381 TaxID=3366164 RepID=UPI00382AEA65
MAMDLRQLHYFTVIFEQRSVSRAAEHLCISQPALTRQLRQLERSLDAVLFERLPQGVSPTAAGQALYGHARLLLRLADTTREVVHSAGPVRESVRTGLPPGTPTPWLTQVLTSLRETVPEAELVLTDANSTGQLRMLREGHLDLALVHQRPPAQLTARLLYEQRIGLAVRPGHSLAARTVCRLEDLDDVRVLVHSREQVAEEHDQILGAAAACGVQPQWIFAWFTENALACATAGDAAAALLTRPSAHRLLPDWTWHPLAEPAFRLPTWIAHQPQTRAIIARVAAAFAAIPFQHDDPGSDNSSGPVRQPVQSAAAMRAAAVLSAVDKAGRSARDQRADGMDREIAAGG